MKKLEWVELSDGHFTNVVSIFGTRFKFDSTQHKDNEFMNEWLAPVSHF